MTTRRTILATWLTATAALLTVCPSASLHAEDPNTLVIVVAKGSPIDDLSSLDLRHLYMGDAVSGPGGKKLVPLSQPANSQERAAFEKAVLKMSHDEVTSYWIDRKIRGQSGPPKAIDSADVMQRVIVRVDGAIGYVRVGDMHADVKVVRIDGKAPRDGGYPLHL